MGSPTKGMSCPGCNNSISTVKIEQGRVQCPLCKAMMLDLGQTTMSRGEFLPHYAALASQDKVIVDVSRWFNKSHETNPPSIVKAGQFLRWLGETIAVHLK